MNNYINTLINSTKKFKNANLTITESIINKIDSEEEIEDKEKTIKELYSLNAQWKEMCLHNSSLNEDFIEEKIEKVRSQVKKENVEKFLKLFKDKEDFLYRYVNINFEYSFDNGTYKSMALKFKLDKEDIEYLFNKYSKIYNKNENN